MARQYKSYKTQALTLKSKNYKDKDKIYTVFTRDFGKITVIGKGVRKINSKRGACLDSLNVVDLSFSKSLDGINYVSEVVVLQTFAKLKADYSNVIHAFYIADLLNRLIQFEESNQEAFFLVVRSLKLLDSGRAKNDFAVNYFELALAKNLGYGLTLDSCVLCGDDFNPSWQGATLNFGLGGFGCSNCNIIGTRLSFSEASFLHKLSVGKFSQMGTDKTNNIVKSYIKNVLEVNVKSLDLLPAY